MVAMALMKATDRDSNRKLREKQRPRQEETDQGTREKLSAAIYRRRANQSRPALGHQTGLSKQIDGQDKVGRGWL